MEGPKGNSLKSLGLKKKKKNPHLSLKTKTVSMFFLFPLPDPIILFLDSNAVLITAQVLKSLPD